MNCKPGDIAIIIQPPLAGRMVEVLYRAPNQSFRLPDGYLHSTPSTLNQWVIKSLAAPFEARIGGGPGIRKTEYAACDDRYLRPLPGKLEDDEVEDARELTT